MTDTPAVAVDAILTDYEWIEPAGLRKCSTPGCTNTASVRSVVLAGFHWCGRCYAALLIERAAYNEALNQAPEQITELTGVLHAVYHLVEDGRHDDAKSLIERTAVRFPECSGMPLAAGS